ncbi:MAG: pseudouridine-5'-phosphate glycosidase, partial [Gemella sp.]
SSVGEPTEIAEIFKTKMELNLNGGMVVANPVPKEHELSKDYIDKIIEEAVKDSIANGISGKDSTPFLLKTIVEKTDGKSLETNIKLVENNAVLGAKIAVAFSKM